MNEDKKQKLLQIYQELSTFPLEKLEKKQQKQRRHQWYTNLCEVLFVISETDGGGCRMMNASTGKGWGNSREYDKVLKEKEEDEEFEFLDNLGVQHEVRPNVMEALDATEGTKKFHPEGDETECWIGDVSDGKDTNEERFHLDDGGYISAGEVPNEVILDDTELTGELVWDGTKEETWVAPSLGKENLSEMLKNSREALATAFGMAADSLNPLSGVVVIGENNEWQELELDLGEISSPPEKSDHERERDFFFPRLPDTPGPYSKVPLQEITRIGEEARAAVHKHEECDPARRILFATSGRVERENQLLVDALGGCKLSELLIEKEKGKR